MRGKRLSKESRKVDVVLVSARYHPETKALDFAQGYVRRGKVWSDQKLLSRADLLGYASQGKRLVSGQPVGVPGEFEQLRPIAIDGSGEGRVLRGEGSPGPGDNLGIPLV